MDREREETHALFNTNTSSKIGMGQDNNSPAENVHNTTSGTLGEWIGKEKKYIHFSIKTYTQNTARTRQQLTSCKCT